MTAVLPATVAVRERIERALEAFLADTSAAIAAEAPDGRILVDELARTLRAGGKRLRPLFCFWGYRAAGGTDDEAIVRAAAALELLHTFALIHDDVMDRSPVRRGMPASHRRLGKHLAAPPSDRDHAGASAAILAGDLAAALADEMFRTAGFAGERLAAAGRLFAAMRVQVIAGQYLDLAAAVRGDATPAETRRISFLKSGGYTVEKPLRIGAALAGAPGGLAAALSRFGVPLGEAFQLRDDILGAFGEPSLTGKDADSDFREGKQTLLVALARERAAPGDAAFLTTRLGAADLTAAEVDRMRRIIVESGARAAVEETIGGLLAAAQAALRAAALPPEPAAALAALADDATLRRR